MHIDNLWLVNILAKRLSENESNRIMVGSGQALGVTIQSTYQPDAIIDAVRPAVIAVIDARIAETKAELLALGVDTEPKTDG